MAEEPARTSSYAPVAITEDFSTTMARMKAAKAAIEERQVKRGEYGRVITRGFLTWGSQCAVPCP
jgi:hypothetical protein